MTNLKTWAEISPTGDRWGMTAWKVEVMQSGRRSLPGDPPYTVAYTFAWTRRTAYNKGARMSRRAHAATLRRMGATLETRPIVGDPS